MLISEVFGSFKKRAGLFVFFSLLVNFSHFIYPVFMLEVYNSILVSYNFGNLMFLFSIAIFLSIVGSKSDSAREQLLKNLALEVRSVVYRDVIRFYTKKNNIKSNKSSDLDLVCAHIAQGAPSKVFDFLFFPIFLFLMFYIHLYFGLALLVIFLIYSSVNIFPLILDSEIPGKSRLLVFEGTLKNNFSIFSRGDVAKPVLNNALIEHENYLGKSLVKHEKDELFSFFNGIIKNSGQIIILAIGAYLVIEGELSPGLMIIASLMFGRTLQPLFGLFSFIKALPSIRASCRDIDEVMESVRNTKPNFNNIIESDIKLEKIIVTNDGGVKPIIKGISFSLQNNQLVVINGNHSSGKTLLLKAIAGIKELKSGSITIGGKRLTSPEDFGEQIYYIDDEKKIIEGTIEDNISLFRGGDRDEILNLTKYFGIHYVIESLPDGYGTYIDRNSSVISTTVKKLIVLCRAFVIKPKVIVMDDPVSDLSVFYKKKLYDLIKDFKNSGGTVLMSSTEMVLPENTDLVVTLDNGLISSVYDPKKPKEVA
ncbi:MULTISPECIES: ATP-binding cassette domain-containing protein [Pseudoalteromonas]|uniref:ABC transmembrane type-1 domain-containing protein n=1 Tax=Pseudoalteromonas amylolytica TaxID=1859457 RepID=A0A1S1MWD1_9GAMM|nr:MULTISPECIES: ATP-binding cassette domain-containing protein [Pseudoalteromonas]OHU86200.1 hypothetical protein BFC16_15975 [Pseudoalteromonas sp. JW3]OHU89694.1 hypothetical protein BET10_16345 [Pseudoalteromonas amylolytica]